MFASGLHLAAHQNGRLRRASRIVCIAVRDVFNPRDSVPYLPYALSLLLTSDGDLAHHLTAVQDVAGYAVELHLCARNKLSSRSYIGNGLFDDFSTSPGGFGSAVRE